MPLQDFLNSIQRGQRIGFPTVQTDDPHSKSCVEEDYLRNAALWLTPKLVEDYSESDFGFVSDEELSRLTRAVENFRSIATQIPTNVPPTKEQLEKARQEFQNILKIADSQKYSDEKAFRVGKQLEKHFAHEPLPEYVRGLRFETDDDAQGDPAIWIWVEIDDNAATPTEFAENTSVVRERIQDLLRRDVPGIWPYVRFRTSSEVGLQATEDVQ